ncbi:MAG: nicotinamide-nucleotide amidohydrolase family protein [Rugosibacter sp.]|jgi:nicotinamide-nucleotide amidase
MDADLAALSLAIGTAALGAAEPVLIATAESCTGGWVAQVITHTAGSSAWFERGFITYANAAKTDMLGVPEATLTAHGAVSEATAQAMAQGALLHSRATHSLAITGIAGPTGGVADKPVGTVCFAWACRHGSTHELSSAKLPRTETRHFTGNRESIRRQAVVHALTTLLARVKEVP